MIDSKYQNFIITSHINDPGIEIKEEMLYQLISGIRKFFNDPFIVLSDSYFVSKKIVDLTDFTLTSRANKNFSYHGNPEIELIKDGLSILSKYDIKYHYRLTYDFIMNEDNIFAYLDWPSKITDEIKLVFAKDSGCHSDGVKTNVWFGDNKSIESLLPNETQHLESDLYSNIKKSNYLNKTFLYENSDEMFHGNTNSYDLIGQGGKYLRKEKIDYFKNFYQYNK
jgi:hypothetical protein